MEQVSMIMLGKVTVSDILYGKNNREQDFVTLTLIASISSLASMIYIIKGAFQRKFPCCMSLVMTEKRSEDTVT